MFARCNKYSIWRIPAHCGSCGRSCDSSGYCQYCRRRINSTGYTVTKGHVGLISNVVDQSGSVQVKWLTTKSGDEAHQLLNQVSYGAFECLDLLTNPVGFNTWVLTIDIVLALEHPNISQKHLCCILWQNTWNTIKQPGSVRLDVVFFFSSFSKTSTTFSQSYHIPRQGTYANYKGANIASRV